MSVCGYDGSFVVLASGSSVGRKFGHVTVMDMAWQMGRLCRWTGSGQYFWSDMLHSFVVADLVKEEYLKIYALIHDCPECVGNDIPAPMKLQETRDVEDAIMERTLDAYGLPRLSQADRHIVKVADLQAAAGEAWVVGNHGNRFEIPDRHLEAEELVRQYLAAFPYVETIERNGRGPKEFFHRFAKYYRIRMVYDKQQASQE